MRKWDATKVKISVDSELVGELVGECKILLVLPPKHLHRE